MPFKAGIVPIIFEQANIRPAVVSSYDEQLCWDWMSIFVSGFLLRDNVRIPVEMPRTVM